MVHDVLVPLLKVVDLTIAVNSCLVCTHLDWEVFPGQNWVILGPNGVGKSTLLRVLAGLEPPQKGQVWLADQEITQVNPLTLAQQRAWLPQNEAYPFAISVLEYLLLGRYPYQQSGHWRHWLAQEDQILATYYLRLLNLEVLQDRDLRTLSGGEQRRVALAGALIQEAPLLLLDEPLSQLDWRYQNKMLAIMKQTLAKSIIAPLPNSNAEQSRPSRSPRAVIWSTHDLNWLGRYSTHALLLMGQGKIVKGPTKKVLTVETLSTLYHTPMAQVMTKQGMIFFPQDDPIDMEGLPPFEDEINTPPIITA